jgi:hypothetical protein
LRDKVEIMKNLLFTFLLVAGFGTATMASGTLSTTTPIACEHCEKDHKCDDKCKKGEKSACCEKAQAKQEGKTDKACCKKGHKSCKSTGKDTKSDKDKS